MNGCGIYVDKQTFVNDFICLCRKLKKENSSLQPVFLHKFFSICGELWSFCIYVDKGMLSTSAELVLNGRSVKFPKEDWGSPYHRWDYELREFLMREICKV